jgi:hypothetical protein
LVETVGQLMGTSFALLFLVLMFPMPITLFEHVYKDRSTRAVAVGLLLNVTWRRDEPMSVEAEAAFFRWLGMVRAWPGGEEYLSWLNDSDYTVPELQDLITGTAGEEPEDVLPILRFLFPGPEYADMARRVRDRKRDLARSALTDLDRWIRGQSIETALTKFDRELARLARQIRHEAVRDFRGPVIRRTFRTLSESVTDWTSGGVIAGVATWLIAEVVIGGQDFTGWVGSAAAIGAFLGVGWADLRLAGVINASRPNDKKATGLVSVTIIAVGTVSAVVVPRMHMVVVRTLEAQWDAITSLPGRPPPATQRSNGSDIAGQAVLAVICIFFYVLLIRWSWRRLKRRGPNWERCNAFAGISYCIAGALIILLLLAAGSNAQPTLAAGVLSICVFLAMLVGLLLNATAAILRRVPTGPGDP